MKPNRMFQCILVAACMAFLLSCTLNHGDKTRVYYVSSSGNDDSPGTLHKPFRSIDRVNLLDLSPGDAVCFEAGQIFKGNLVLDSLDSGSGVKSVEITSYGEGTAILDGGAGSALHADGCTHLSIRNLSFRGDGREEGNTGNGIDISNGDFINLDNLEVSGFQKSGLRFHACDHSRINHVYAHDNGFAGIYVMGTTENDPVNYDNQDLYIGYCVAENNPGDPTELNSGSGFGILAHSVEGGVIEYCEAFNNGWDTPWNGGPGPKGISVWDCTDFIVQHCIAHDNRTIPGGHDGGGFVFDRGTSNSIIQYCISFHNEGAGFGLFEHGGAKPWGNNIIRFNISQDDGIVNHYASVGIWKIEDLGVMSDCEIYNNTFYNSNPGGSALWIWEDYPGFNFSNNVFIYKGPYIWESRKLTTVKFQGNCYWNLDGKPEIQGYSGLEEWARATGNEMIENVPAGIYADPVLNDPGTLAVTDPAMINRETLNCYMPEPGSPLIDRGLNLMQLFGLNTGDHDLLGTPVPYGEASDIGAVEHIHD
jgi:hypothetical protein